MRYLLSCILLGLLAAPAMAITVDGTREAGYGSALAVQTVETQFGDANPNGGSEWDGGYGVIEGGRLYLMLTGNLEANFNKLEIWIDSAAGGQSVFDSSGNDNAQRMDGLVFDAGFTADYHIIARRGNDMGNDKFDLDFANLGAQSASGYLDIMGGNSGTGSTGTGVNASPIDVGYDNSNTLGVAGGTGPANQAAAAAVTTGLELSIALSDLGYTGGSINVMVGQNGGGHDFFSNQFLGGLTPPQGNLGGDGNGNFTGTAAINFQNFAGQQYFTVPVPEPASVTLVGLVLVGLASVRRRK
jgi:PEP-CTERM motif